jgi:hypothetical protein
MMEISNGLIERFLSVLPMTVSSQPGKEVESKSHLDCFALLAMTHSTVCNRAGREGAATPLPPSLHFYFTPSLRGGTTKQSIDYLLSK